MPDRDRVLGFSLGAQVDLPLQKLVVGPRVRRPGHPQTALLGGTQGDAEHGYQSSGNRGLEVETLIQVLREPLGPELIAGPGADEPEIHVQAVALALEPTFDGGVHTQRTGQFCRGHVAGAVSHHGRAGNDPQRPDLADR